MVPDRTPVGGRSHDGAFDSARGVVLIVTLHVLLLLMGVGAALVPVATLDTSISANHRRAVQLRYDAESALEWVIAELGQFESWDQLAAGSVVSTLWSRSPAVHLADGAELNLSRMTTDLIARGYGPDGIGRRLPWRMFAHGRIDQIAAHSSPVPMPSYVAVWLAAASLEQGQAEWEALVVYALAAGPRGGRRAIQATIRRARKTDPIELVSWVIAR